MDKTKVTVAFSCFCSRYVTRITDTVITSGTYHVGSLRSSLAPTSCFIFQYGSFSPRRQPADISRWTGCIGDAVDGDLRLVSGAWSSFFVLIRRNSLGILFLIFSLFLKIRIMCLLFFGEKTELSCEEWSETKPLPVHDNVIYRLFFTFSFHRHAGCFK